ncbi:MAG TPA: cytochrome c [Steroidobacteraceae bacterium]|nr:cytochrome c [Steroidobacteraceae bacterium]
MHQRATSNLVRAVAIAAALLSALGAGTFAARAADAPPSKEEQAIKYRQSVYKVILWNFGPMAGMAQGKIPYDAKAFAHHAERVATMAPMLLEGYPEGSDRGAKTRARPEIWQNKAEFTELMHNMEEKTAALAVVAKDGDFEKSKAAFGEAASACKACHEKYRTD